MRTDPSPRYPDSASREIDDSLPCESYSIIYGLFEVLGTANKKARTRARSTSVLGFGEEETEVVPHRVE